MSVTLEKNDLINNEVEKQEKLQNINRPTRLPYISIVRIFQIIVLTKLKEKRRQIFSRELETIKKYKMELLEVKRNN